MDTLEAKQKEKKMEYSEEKKHRISLTVILIYAALKNLSTFSSALALLEHGKIRQDRAA